MRDIKQKLFEACLLFVANRFKIITEVIESNQTALKSETKSSAGDKHETGRAMLQLEIEKASQQLASAKAMQKTLSKVNLEKTSLKISLGSLVITNMANYFVAISAGKINIGKEIYFAISLNSPIGMQMLGKKIGDEIAFNKAQILEVY